jgi:indole-3-glycerol phosphate synthase
MTVLDEIIANKKREISAVKRLTGIRSLEKRDLFTRKTLSLSESLKNPGTTGIIAEFKRKSPSGGSINIDASLEHITTGYRSLGAAGLSVLTDYKYFGGSDCDISLARKLNDIPVLRKEFIINEYQVIESKAIGADAILLIAAVLNRKMVRDLAYLGRSLGLEVMLEIHVESELSMLNEFITMAGVNNRNLSTLKVDITNSLKLIGKIPEGFTKVSESGLDSPEVVKDLKNAGFDGFLIGEHFMNNVDPVQAFAEFVKELK